MSEISIVPPFDRTLKKEDRYDWWSWHPLHPKWEKSCWGGATIEEAYTKIGTDYACELERYHNKLIKCDGISYEEVADRPCQDMEKWNKSLERVKKREQ